MAKDILTLISSKMNTFSKGQKLIANYILTNYDKAAFMTASKLGKTVHVSESTVVRFASELKYDGYPAMQKALQEMIRNKLTSIQRMEVSNDIIGNQDVVSSVMQSDMEKIRMTMEELERQSEEKQKAAEIFTLYSGLSARSLPRRSVSMYNGAVRKPSPASSVT